MKHDKGTPELQKKISQQESEFQNDVEAAAESKRRGGVEYLFMRKSIGARQFRASRQYRTWHEKRYAENSPKCSLSNLIPDSPNDDAAVESRYLEVMESKEWYIRCRNFLLERGVKTGKYHYEALDIVAIQSKPISDFEACIRSKGVKIGRDTARKWVRDAMLDLADYIDELIAVHERKKRLNESAD